MGALLLGFRRKTKRRETQMLGIRPGYQYILLEESRRKTNIINKLKLLVKAIFLSIFYFPTTLILGGIMYNYLLTTSFNIASFVGGISLSILISTIVAWWVWIFLCKWIG